MTEPSSTLAGVVLAAGRSSRMGRTKALLDAGGEPFVVRAVTCLLHGGVGPVVTVLRSEAREVARAAQAAGSRIVVNPAPDDPDGGGPLSSLRLAIRALTESERDLDGLLLLPVDHPRVRSSTVRALVDSFRHSGAPVTVPVWRGRRGHPVVLAASLFDELLTGDLPDGARTVVHRYGDERVDVEVEDPGVVDDLDTPDAYRRAFA